MVTSERQMFSDIKIIGFDLDGTLYPSTPEIPGRIRTTIYKKISHHFKIPFEQAKTLFEETYSRLCSGSKTIEELEKQIGKNLDHPDFLQEALEEADILDLIQPNPELVRMLSRLSQTKRSDLLTGSAYSLALKKLNRIGIEPKIFQQILAHESGSKSSGSLYKTWLSLANYPPERFLYVGDNEKLDIEVPKSLGIKTCSISDETSADFKISNILDLESLL